MDRKELKDTYDRFESKRATSAAKEHDPDGLKGTSLEKAPDVNQQFEKAQKGRAPEKQQDSQEKTGPTVQSQQVRNAGPKLDGPKPPEQERQKHPKDMAGDDKAVDEANRRAMLDSLRERQNRQKEQDRDKMNDGKDHD